MPVTNFNTTTAVKVGTTDISAVYRGGILIWSKLETLPPPTNGQVYRFIECRGRYVWGFDCAPGYDFPPNYNGSNWNYKYEYTKDDNPTTFFSGYKQCDINPSVTDYSSGMSFTNNIMTDTTVYVRLINLDTGEYSPALVIKP